MYGIVENTSHVSSAFWETFSSQSSNNLGLPGVPTVQYLNNQHARGLLLNASVQTSKDVKSEVPKFCMQTNHPRSGRGPRTYADEDALSIHLAFVEEDLITTARNYIQVNEPSKSKQECRANQSP